MGAPLVAVLDAPLGGSLGAIPTEHRGHADARTDVDEALSLWEKRLGEVASRLTPEGSIWLAARNAWRDDELVPWPFLLAARAQACGLKLKNVLVRHDAFEEPGKPLAAAHETILFLVADLQKYRFDKTPLREPHVYKDLDWGRREVGVTGYHDASRKSARYPEGGRDPGNVLARARRDAEGRVLALEAYPRLELFDKLARASSEDGWTVLTNVPGLAVAGRRMEAARW